MTIQMTKHFEEINSGPGNIFRQKIFCCFAHVCKHPILLCGVGGDFVDIKNGLFLQSQQWLNERYFLDQESNTKTTESEAI